MRSILGCLAALLWLTACGETALINQRTLKPIAAKDGPAGGVNQDAMPATEQSNEDDGTRPPAPKKLAPQGEGFALGLTWEGAEGISRYLVVEALAAPDPDFAPDDKATFKVGDFINGKKLRVAAIGEKLSFIAPAFEGTTKTFGVFSIDASGRYSRGSYLDVKSTAAAWSKIEPGLAIKLLSTNVDDAFPLIVGDAPFKAMAIGMVPSPLVGPGYPDVVGSVLLKNDLSFDSPAPIANALDPQPLAYRDRAFAVPGNSGFAAVPLAGGMVVAVWTVDRVVWSAIYTPGQGWSRAASLGDQSTPADDPGFNLFFEAAGNETTAIFAWSHQSARPCDAPYAVRAVVFSATTGFGPVRTLLEPGLCHNPALMGVAMAPSGKGVLIARDDFYDNGAYTPPQIYSYDFNPSRGEFGAKRTLPSPVNNPRALRTQLAIADSGEFIVSLLGDRRNNLLYPTELAAIHCPATGDCNETDISAAARTPVLAMNPEGHALLAWEQVDARSRRARIVVREFDPKQKKWSEEIGGLTADQNSARPIGIAFSSKRPDEARLISAEISSVDPGAATARKLEFLSWSYVKGIGFGSSPQTIDTLDIAADAPFSFSERYSFASFDETIGFTAFTKTSPTGSAVNLYLLEVPAKSAK